MLEKEANEYRLRRAGVFLAISLFCMTSACGTLRKRQMDIADVYVDAIDITMLEEGLKCTTQKKDSRTAGCAGLAVRKNYIKVLRSIIDNNKKKNEGFKARFGALTVSLDTYEKALERSAFFGDIKIVQPTKVKLVGAMKKNACKRKKKLRAAIQIATPLFRQIDALVDEELHKRNLLSLRKLNAEITEMHFRVLDELSSCRHCWWARKEQCCELYNEIVELGNGLNASMPKTPRWVCNKEGGGSNEKK